MLLRTKKFTPKLRDSRQSNFLHHPLLRSPPEFLHQLGNFTPAALVTLVRFCISVKVELNIYSKVFNACIMIIY